MECRQKEPSMGDREGGKMKPKEAILLTRPQIDWAILNLHDR